MAYYQNLKDPKKEKKRYSYGAEEGTYYNRNKRNEEKASGRKTENNSKAQKRVSDRAAGPESRNKAIRRTSPGIRRHDEKTDTAASAESYADYEYQETKNSRFFSGNREEHERYILTGRNPIREALKNHRDLEKLLVQRGELSGSAMEIVQKAKEQRVMVQIVDKSRLDEIAQQHQGLIAFASAYQYSTVEEILAYADEKGEAPFIVILDGVTDPHNLGAIIRTAECAGAHGVIVPQHRSVGLTPSAVKASAGAVEYVKVARVTNLNRTIEYLQKKNIWIYALDMDGTDYLKIRFEGGTALVIGAEGEGISRLTGTKCDMKVALPMKGHIDSLNASVAAGIMLYRVMNCRNME